MVKNLIDGNRYLVRHKAGSIEYVTLEYWFMRREEKWYIPVRPMGFYKYEDSWYPNDHEILDVMELPNIAEFVEHNETNSMIVGRKYLCFRTSSNVLDGHFCLRRCIGSAHKPDEHKKSNPHFRNKDIIAWVDVDKLWTTD